MTPAEPSDISRMRISDADRDRAAAVLAEALAQGRLTADEHSERLDAVYAARTQADIMPMVSDLPGASAALAVPQSAYPAVPQSAYPAAPSAPSRPARMVAIFSGLSRKGSWRVPQETRALTVFGGAELDLREAVLPARQITIRATCVLGSVDITVPPEMHVVDDGWAFMGGREMPPDSPESAGPDAPVLRLTGMSILAGISVKRRPRGHL